MKRVYYVLCVVNYCCNNDVFEGPNVKVLLKASQRLVIRNLLQRVKHGSLFTVEIQVCIFEEFLEGR